MIEAVIFDVGGVLHTYNSSLVKQEVRSVLEVPGDIFNQFWTPLTTQLEVGQLTEGEYWQQFQNLTKSHIVLPQESPLIRGLKEGFQIKADVVEIAKKLKMQNFRLAVLSNTIPSHVEYVSRRGLYDDFDICVFSFTVGVKKPNPLMYQAVLEQLNITPESGVFIDDRAENVLGASNIGLKSFQFTTAERLRSDLAVLGIHV